MAGAQARIRDSTLWWEAVSIWVEYFVVDC